MFLCGAQDARFLTLTSTLPHYAIAAVTSVFFQAIQQLKAERASQGIRGDGYAFVSHLTPTQQLTLARLVGLKCKLLSMLSAGDC